MAIVKRPSSSSLVIEIENGVNEKGESMYRKKTLSNLDPNASSENIHSVCNSIATVLSSNTGCYYIKDTSELISQE